LVEVRADPAERFGPVRRGVEAVLLDRDAGRRGLAAPVPVPSLAISSMRLASWSIRRESRVRSAWLAVFASSTRIVRRLRSIC
jgi:hypothetical protein